MSSTTRTLWDRLTDESTDAGKHFMPHYNELNNKLGNALGRLEEQPQDIQGRDHEIRLLHAILERPKTPIALLLGQAGVGKTALAEEFAKQLNQGKLDTHTDYQYLLVALRLGTLASLGHNQLQTRLSTLLLDFEELERQAQQATGEDNIRVVLFMDEVHMLVTMFGAGTKVGGDVMKDVLARAPIRVIAATTRREYDSTIAVDKPLSERFKQIEMDELPADIVVDIVQNWWEKVAPDCPELEESLIRKIIEANAMYRSDSAEPRKSLDIVEDLVSYCRRTGNKPNADVVDDVFKRRYSISLKFDVDADSVYEEISRRVKGQPHALYELRRLLRSIVFQLDPTSNKPIMTALFTGSTGTGKTETTKAIAHALYPDEPVLLNINMPDYKNASDEGRFRKRLGEFVRHTPNAVVLLDELEKAADELKDALLVILDEGLVTFETVNREGAVESNTVSLRNTVIICTTNAGAEVFDNDNRYSQRTIAGEGDGTSVQRAEIDTLMKSLRAHLINTGIFKPEMLGRFNRLIPYRALSEGTLLNIAEIKLQQLYDKFYKMHGIEIVTKGAVQWPENAYDYTATELAMFITFFRAKANESNSGGARSIQREIESTVSSDIIDTVIEQPGHKKFLVEMSTDSPVYIANGKPVINHGVASTQGGVKVHAIKDD